MSDLIGTLVDAGLDAQQARELVGPEINNDPGVPIEPIVRTLLTVARDDRQPPGPHVSVPSGVINSMPDSQNAMPVRVDTEDTYRAFRGGTVTRDFRETLDDPEHAESIADVLDALSQQESGLNDTDDFQRGYASEWITGNGRKGKRKRSRVGDIMTRGAASEGSLFDNPALSSDQACMMCGVESKNGGPVCVNCLNQPAIMGLFDRGAASNLYGPPPTTRYVRPAMLGADMYRLQRMVEESATMLGAEDADEFYRLQRHLEESATMLGAEEFYRLQHQLDESATAVLGSDEFYRLQHQTQERAALLGADQNFYRMEWQTQGRAILGADATDPDSTDRLRQCLYNTQALTSPSDTPAESIPLSFAQPDANEHVATWKQGDQLYASMRVMGWDGRPRVLTATTPYSREVSAVVGYAEASRIPPAHTLAVLDPLARTLGASRLVPKLAASAPAVLRTAHGKLTPLVMATMPVTNSRV